MNPDLPYVTVDPEKGYLLRFFNVPQAKSLLNRKQDVIQIPFEEHGKIFLEQRRIIEVINDNTVIVDKAYEKLAKLPEYIFDYKESSMAGAKDPDYMSIQERQQHLKSYGLEIIHQNLVYCKRCNFAMHYAAGDVLVFDHNWKTYTATITRLIEDNLLEITRIQGLEDLVIVIDNYYVLKQNSETPIVW